MLRKTLLIIICSSVFWSCEKEQPIAFSETIISPETTAIIEVVYPKFQELSSRDRNINAKLSSEISKSMQFSDTLNAKLSIEDAIILFDKDYLAFKNKYPDSQMQWSTTVDSEVIYQSPNIVCVGVNTYMNTGGAHGNSYIKLLNFNTETGDVLDKTAIIDDTLALSKIAKQYFLKETEAEIIEGKIENYFWDKEFQLPEEIGFNDEGLLLLYNTYEIASYAQGIIEFTIPFEEINTLLKAY